MVGHEQEQQQLVVERRYVESEIERLSRILSEEPDLELEDGDPEIIEREKSLALIRSFELRLEEIDNALKQIEVGTYGICERCGNPINPERLKIMPEAKYCISCQTAIEKRTRRRR